MFNKLKFASSFGLFCTLLVMAPVSEAALINYNFNGAIDSGALLGEIYSGSFSFDNAVLSNTGSESVILSSFAINFHATTYHLADANFPSTADFLNGLFLGVSYSASGFEPSFALVSAAGLGLPDDLPYFSYDTVSGDSGFGSLNFTNVSSVPLPGAVWLFGSGLAALMASCRRKI